VSSNKRRKVNNGKPTSNSQSIETKDTSQKKANTISVLIGALSVFLLIVGAISDTLGAFTGIREGVSGFFGVDNSTIHDQTNVPDVINTKETPVLSVGSLKSKWTMLIYVSGDNSLDPWLNKNTLTDGMMHRLQNSQPVQSVQTAVLYDGPNGTYRVTIKSDGKWFEENLLESSMGDSSTLSSFLVWGINSLPSEHYVVILSGFSDSLHGFGWDEHSGNNTSKNLSATSLRRALENTYTATGRKIDILHVDGSNFGLLEALASAENFADFIIAPTSNGWGVFPYEKFREAAGGLDRPVDYAIETANIYSSIITEQRLPYVIAVYDMQKLRQTIDVVGNFGNQLCRYIQENPASNLKTIQDIRSVSQKYNSIGEDQYEIDSNDSYLDIVDFAVNVSHTIDDQALKSTALSVQSTVFGDKPFIIRQIAVSGEMIRFDPFYGKEVNIFVDLSRANGLAVYYPSLNRPNQKYMDEYQKYINDEIFDITIDWGWSLFVKNCLQ